MGVNLFLTNRSFTVDACANKAEKACNGTESSITVDACAAGAEKAFNSTSDRIYIKTKSGDHPSECGDHWVEVMHEMLPLGDLCAIIDLENVKSLRDRLVSLTVKGVSSIILEGRTKQVVQNSLFLANKINREESLGLQFLV